METEIIKTADENIVIVQGITENGIDIKSIVVPEGYELVKKQGLSEQDILLLQDKKKAFVDYISALETKINSFTVKIKDIKDLEIKEIVMNEIEKLTLEKCAHEVDILEIDKQLQ